MSQVEKAKNEDFSGGCLLDMPSPSAREVDAYCPKPSLSDAPQSSSDSVVRHSDDDAKVNSERGRDWDATELYDTPGYWGA
jgi:hypothetical protein